jgi:hypothetical protein
MEHIAKYSKNYQTIEEFSQKQARFFEVDKIIQNHNKNPHKNFTLRHNRMSDKPKSDTFSKSLP